MTLSVAFIGLGVMGYPMAGHLQRSGYAVTVFNRSTNKATAWVETYKGLSAPSIADVVKNKDMVFCCVGNDDDVREVALIAFAHMKPNSVFVDHTTASAHLARELHAMAKQKHIGFLDAPVSGGQAGAENGQLSIMIGGDQSDFDAVAPVIQCYAKIAQLIGPSGSGQLCKMVNQICITGLIQSLAEAIHFAESAELDIEKVMAVISKGAAQSWQMENRYKTMVQGQYDFGFAVDWMRKDLGIVLDEARCNGARLPVAALIDQFYGEVQTMGGRRWDTSSLLARLKNVETNQ